MADGEGKETRAKLASVLASKRAKLHAACKSGKPEGIKDALKEADDAFDAFKKKVEADKEKLDQAIALL